MRVRDTESFFPETGNLGTREFVSAIEKIGLKNVNVKYQLKRNLVPKTPKKQILFWLNVIKRKVDFSCRQLKYELLSLPKQADPISLAPHRYCESKRMFPLTN